MSKTHVFVICCFFLLGASALPAQPHLRSAKALLHRTLPDRADEFVVEALTATGTQDAFEIESRGSKIVLRGTTGVAIASALYFYLTEYAHCQITWNGTNVKLPRRLPAVEKKIRRTSPYTYRYYLNYCTFNYTMSWWDWSRWEKEIDWMALHGITMPLAITGEEYVWHEVYTSLGFSNEDLNNFFCGPTYFSWFWMGNLDGWGGPLPLRWMEEHKQLQQKILKRERELGMKPVLPAFTGHVPSAFSKYFPHAKLKKTNWGNDFSDTYILNSDDSMFAELGRIFLKTQTRLYGTDHLYSADTFNENEPPSDHPDYLASLSARVYEGMKRADPEAIWVMQGWLFYSDRKFWKPPQIQALLDAVPDDRMILLDLAAEIEPVWKRTSAFYGKPWIWNMLHNFGGNITMFGRLDGVAEGPALALNDSSSRKLAGIGLTMEGIEQNPVLYELMTSHIWRRSAIDLDQWLPEYVRNRYGVADERALDAWKMLRSTVYNGKTLRDGAESIIAARPTFESGTRWVRTALNYQPEELLPAWQLLIGADRACQAFDGYRYDIVDVTRQVLANYAMVLHQKFTEAYRQHDSSGFTDFSTQFIDLISDMDLLLATRKDFLLGPWIADARKWGATGDEKALYERNARDLITLWGGPNNRLHEYSCRQWSGVLSDFYRPRWERFFQEIGDELRGGKKFDAAAFEREMQQWEWTWVTTEKSFPVTPSGDPVRMAKRMYKKYYHTIRLAYGNGRSRE
ncbi:MAG TPA: alpha-N-acetylglucosaminidase [Bacteroidota bacterium]|nr:alpha-N-acetylglucosaminidase [Bacteroidota bacterium]